MTRQDDETADIKIEEYERYEEEEILELYRSVGWSKYCDPADVLRAAFSHSLYMAGMRKDGKLIGLIRTVGDGYSIVYIQDLLVAPAYQRQGLGSRLLKHVVDRFDRVYQMVATTEHLLELARFYEKNGFDEMQEWSCASFLRRGRVF